MTALAAAPHPVPRLAVVRLGAAALPLPAHEPVPLAEHPDAVLVLTDGEPHPELWADPPAPVLVVLPPWAGADRVLAAFAGGADACVRATSGAEVEAHLAALLRRRHQA